ncbi:hypothetical protein QKW35_10335 [Pontibacterium granulatum]|uniref:hypothetical protein n=1 Tax=Pontibacterium granulatum TaxID=2036029 RepID=UPI00249C4536|nr:hypothetical protein [Pontibacterium granulatum]MDI3324774.1 hypothetical protein [Pontibacterium granulatum]
MLSVGVDKPSELDSIWGDLDQEKSFFLESICTPEIMGILVEIDTKQKLLFERLKVIDFLKTRKGEGDEALNSEEQKIYEELLLDNVSSHSVTNKITIDSDGIKKSKLKDYGAYLEYLGFLDGISESDLANFVNDSGEEISEDEIKQFLIGTVYDSVLEDFVFDGDHGLVRYLSSEIRHGVLPNQIRSVLEASNLVTVKVDENSYESNSYWRNQYALAAQEDFLDFVDEQLAWFSTKVDELIDLANGWPVATRDATNRSVAFNLSYSSGKLEEFREFTSPANTPEEFFTLCEDFVWQQLDTCFRVMRSLINKDLKPKFNKLFDELVLRLKSNPAKIELNILREEIFLAKNKVIEELSLIEGWFVKPGNDHYTSISLDYALKISIENVRGIYDPREIAIDFEGVDSDCSLNKNEMVGLVRSLVTSYQNAINHGCKNTGFKVVPQISDDGRDIEIVVSNFVSVDKLREINRKKILDKVPTFSVDDNHELLTTEGGTGLYKTYRYLIDFCQNAQFSVSVDENVFSQKMCISKAM